MVMDSRGRADSHRGCNGQPSIEAEIIPAIQPGSSLCLEKKAESPSPSIEEGAVGALIEKPQNEKRVESEGGGGARTRRRGWMDGGQGGREGGRLSHQGTV